MDDIERFSDTVLEEVSSPFGMERLFEPDGYAMISGGCGDTMEVFLRLHGQERIHMSFLTDGCIATVACGSMLSKLVKDKTVGDVLGFVEEDIISALGGLPEDHRHCATLTLDTLFKALLDLMTKNEQVRSNEPLQ
jgi:nitrogen fixation NifU-like protein